MRLQEIILGISEQVSLRGVPSAPRAVLVADVDDDLEADAEYLGDAEGQSFMIEYVDSGGRPSTRRISVYGLSLGRAGIPLLTAKCHERRATRQFRVDRIKCCIDYGGEVFDDVPAFLSGNFGMSVVAASRKTDGTESARWSDILDRVRDDATILAAMAKADGEVHRLEVDAAVRHLAHISEMSGFMLSEADVIRLAQYFDRLRPSPDRVAKALGHLVDQEPSVIRRLLINAVAVLNADGLRHPAELLLLNELALELTGVSLA